MQQYEIIDEFLRQLNSEVQKKEELLQVEDNGSKIANAQGFCAGARDYRDALREAEIDASENGVETPYIDADLKYKELGNLCARISEFKGSDAYQRLQEIKKSKIDFQKNQLFYNSEKGRDLHWAKGWHEAITQIEKWAGEIKRRYDVETERRQKSLSLFEDDDE